MGGKPNALVGDWLAKHILAPPYNGILHSCEKDGGSSLCAEVKEFQDILSSVKHIKM